MKSFHDYESLGRVQLDENLEPPILEAYAGASIVSWYGTIENQLQTKLDDAEASRNFETADRVRAFLKTWRENEITGSMNIDELVPLKAAAEQQSSVKWNLRSYFSSLLNQLRKLIASEEELPRGIDTDQIDPMAGGMGSAPPMSPDFGPEEEAPGELGAEPKPEDGEGGIGDEKALDAALDATDAGAGPDKKANPPYR